MANRNFSVKQPMENVRLQQLPGRLSAGHPSKGSVALSPTDLVDSSHYPKKTDMVRDGF
jgi:hypothetical protein